MSLLNLFVAVDDFCQMLSAQGEQPRLGQAKRRGRRPSLTAVSYTHLDVYKRQAIGSEA